MFQRTPIQSRFFLKSFTMDTRPHSITCPRLFGQSFLVRGIHVSPSFLAFLALKNFMLHYWSHCIRICTVGLNIGILIIWVFISSTTLVGLQWYVRKQDVEAVRMVEKRRAVESPSGDEKQQVWTPSLPRLVSAPNNRGGGRIEEWHAFSMLPIGLVELRHCGGIAPRDFYEDSLVACWTQHYSVWIHFHAGWHGAWYLIMSHGLKRQT